VEKEGKSAHSAPARQRQHTRVRKTPDERRREILAASIRLIGEYGFNGISLKDVADAVGMSQPGLLHYVGTKEGLLSMLVTDVYDTSGTPEDFFASGLPGSDPKAPHFPAYLRFLVRHNADRPALMQLYVVLQSEAVAPNHPMYEYFQARPEQVWNYYSEFPWKLPDSVGEWPNMRSLVRMSIEAMDGVQLRVLRQPAIDLYDEWLAFEKLLFPADQWEGCL
jgi:AcrR family transcriptional regulator